MTEQTGLSHDIKPLSKDEWIFSPLIPLWLVLAVVIDISTETWLDWVPEIVVSWVLVYWPYRFTVRLNSVFLPGWNASGLSLALCVVVLSVGAAMVIAYYDNCLGPGKVCEP